MQIKEYTRIQRPDGTTGTVRRVDSYLESVPGRGTEEKKQATIQWSGGKKEVYSLTDIERYFKIIEEL